MEIELIIFQQAADDASFARAGGAADNYDYMLRIHWFIIIVIAR